LTSTGAIDLSSGERDFTRDPYPVYAGLRDSAPVCPVQLHGLQGWLVTRYDDVRQALGDSSLSNDRSAAQPAARSASWLFADEPFQLQHHMLRSDPPRHTQIRRIVSYAFTARQVAGLRPRIEQLAHGLVDQFAADGRTELISSYAFPLPLAIIMEIMGIPPADQERLRGWSDVLSSGSAASPDDVAGILNNMREYFRAVVVHGPPGADAGGLLAVLAACYRDQELTEDELLSSAFQILQGGHVTTLGLIANGVLALLSDPRQLDALKARPELTESAVEELLRFDPPMEVATVRFTTKPLRIGATTIPGDGQPVMLALAAANRDPARFPDPDTLDLGRDGTGHLSFAHGIHYCLGAHLARLELQVAFRVLIDRLDDLALAVDPRDLIWRPNPHLRRPERLPVTFTVRR
jgi:cytochrome P450